MTELKSENRQTIRSKRMLRDGLVALLKQKPYQKISITEITQQADVARSTFYAHFETKDELLNFFVDDILDQFFKSVSNWPDIVDDPDYENRIGTTFFQLWQDNEDIARILNTVDIDCLLINRFKVLFEKLFTYKVGLDQIEINPNLIWYLINYNAYALVGIFKQWIDDNMRYLPEVVGQFVAFNIGPERGNEAIALFNNIFD